MKQIRRVVRRIRSLFAGAAGSRADASATIAGAHGLEIDIPYPKVDLAQLPNPLPAITSTSEYDEAGRYFARSPAAQRALISARSQAVIYALIRNQRPAHVVEIGTYRGGTTETMARAVCANGTGMVHTVGPFDSETFMPTYRQWPKELQQVVKFYPMDSMAFYMEMEQKSIPPDLVFVDGNHDYEFALFDILCAARRLSPGGFIIADDASQVGPYFAAQDFLSSHPDWIDCVAHELKPRDRTKAFDLERTHVPETGLIVLRAPTGHRLFNDRPWTFGEAIWQKPEIRGLNLSIDGRQGAGTLHVQCILRGFGGGMSPAQVVGEGRCAVEQRMGELDVSLRSPVRVNSNYDRYRLEVWLIWIGQGPLGINAAPVPY